METTKFTEKLGQLINRAQTEIDELRVKIALGKMNGADLFEEMKKELGESFHHITAEVKEEGEEAFNSVKSRIEALQVQLALGKVEALDAYEEQKARINAAIDDLEQNIRDSRSQLSYDAKIKIHNEIEKFKLKMDVLKIRYELGRLDLKESVESKTQYFRKEFDQLLEQVKDKADDKIEAYGKNIKDAYESLRKSL
jgi:uncharacterized protein YicC (UPF0701 family)